jgi:hypothetical protein
VDFLPNTVSILLFALLIGGSVYVGLRLLFRAEDSPRAQKTIKIVVLSVGLVAYLALAFTGLADREVEPAANPGVLTLQSDVELAVTVRVEAWQQSLDGFGLTWPPAGEMAPADPDEQVLGSITGTLNEGAVRREATIGIGGGGITGFKCVVVGIQEQSESLAFFDACWEAAKVSGADTEAGRQWVEETVAALYEPGAGSDVIRSTETVCPAELTMLSIGTSDTYRSLTFNILPSPVEC